MPDKKPHHNTGKKNALKYGRSKTAVMRVTPEHHAYLYDGVTSAADKVAKLIDKESKNNG